MKRKDSCYCMAQAIYRQEFGMHSGITTIAGHARLTADSNTKLRSISGWPEHFSPGFLAARISEKYKDRQSTGGPVGGI